MKILEALLLMLEMIRLSDLIKQKKRSDYPEVCLIEINLAISCLKQTTFSNSKSKETKNLNNHSRGDLLRRCPRVYNLI